MVNLVRIELENFKCFFGKKDVDIGLSNKNLVIFEGDTGAGKSSLLEAINWCLFGKYPSFETEKVRDFNLFSDQSIVDADIGEVVTCKVTLTFEKKDELENERISFSREMQVKRIKKPSLKKGTSYSPEVDEFFFVTQPGGVIQKFSAIKWEGYQQMPLESNVILTREKYFPQIVSDYYMIYGEKFIDPRDPEKIRLATERNCFGEIFDKIKDNLTLVKHEIIKNNAKKSNKREKLNELIKDQSSDIQTQKVKKENMELFKKQRTEMEKIISEIDKEMGKAEGNRANKLNSEREKNLLRIKELNKELKEKEKEIFGDGFKLLIKLYAEEPMKELFTELSKKVKEGEIPPKIKTEFINSLLKEKICICQRKLGKKESDILKEIRDENELADNSEEFLEMKYEINSELEDIAPSIEEHINKLSLIEKIRNERVELDERLKIISEELSGLKDMEKLEKERKILDSNKNRLDADIIILGRELEDLSKNIKNRDKEINKFGEIGSDESVKANVFITGLSNNIEKIKKEVIESTRKDIESYASEIYKDLFKSSTKIKKVELDEDYNVKVIIIQKDGKEYLKTKFSTGESLVFAISFLTALRKYSGYQGPIFLDSPYSVLDPIHRKRIALNLPESVPGQLIILTRADTFEDIKLKIKPYINKVITLEKEREWHTKISTSKI